MEPDARTPEKLLLVDWDDTVFPTSFLDQQDILRSFEPVPADLRAELRKYAKRVEATFDILSLHGRVVIVTNAKEGWIDTSCARFMPDLVDVIRTLPRISARPPEFDDLSEPRPTDWKEEAFLTLAQMHFAEPAGQPVFSLGDSIYERDAVRRISERLGVVTQTVKLLDSPTLEALKAEHAAMQDGCLEELLRRADSFDVCVKVDVDAMAEEAQAVEDERTACAVSPKVPDCIDGSWSELREAISHLGEAGDMGAESLSGSQKSTSSLNSQVSTVSTMTTESVRLAQLSPDWAVMV